MKHTLSPCGHTYKVGLLTIRLLPFSQQLFYVLILLGAALPVAWLGNPLLGRVAAAGEYALAWVLSALGLMLGVFLLHLLRRAGLILAPFCAGLLFAFTHITAAYNIEPGPSFIGSIMETTSEEAFAFITPMLVLHGIAVAALFTGFVWWSRRWFTPWNAVILLLLAAHVLLAQTSRFTANATKDMRDAARWSMEYIHAPIKYALDFPKRDRDKVEQLRALPDPALRPFQRTRQDPLIIVFITGESLRADHLGINGYARDTTPRLAREKLVNFPHTRSFAAWTRESVIGIFTDRLPDQETSRQGSFVRVFQKAGFAVTTYNANTKPNRSDFSLAILTEGARRFYAPRPDMNMVDILRKQLGAQDLELHILSPYGSHFSYRDAYPPEDAVFKPDDFNRPVRMDELPLLVNSYDNSVAYTDKVIAATIDLLRERNAVLIYVSDHGESLGEEGRLMHGEQSAPEQRQVPFFFWFSERYRSTHAKLIANLESRTGEQVQHCNIFHTIFSIADIETQARDASLDLTVPRLR